MNRNNMERFDEKRSQSLKNNKKNRIEKGIVSGALIVILIALLIIPKYEAYRNNKSILADKVRYNLELPDQMTEETYLKELKKIGGELDETRNNLPDNLDTVRLYQAVAKMAESAEVGLSSLEFGPIDILIDEQLGVRIAESFQKNEEKSIKGPDGKFLATCEFAVVCSGNDESFMAFLNELNQSSPIIRVISYEIEKGTTEKKQMRLKLESYGIQEDTPANEENEAVYQQ